MRILLENPYIALIIFPYVYGEHFVYYLHNYSCWSIVNKAYWKPPISTSMVMHPEKYLHYLYSGDPGFEEPMINCRVSGDRVYGDRLGEYYILLVLAQGMGMEKAVKIAEQWRGDRVELYRLENATHTTWSLCWNTTWATEKASQEFYTSLTQSLEKIGNITNKTDFEIQVIVVQYPYSLYTKITLSKTWVFITSVNSKKQ
jgi:hypothetical protein